MLFDNGTEVTAMPVITANTFCAVYNENSDIIRVGGDGIHYEFASADSNLIGATTRARFEDMLNTYFLFACATGGVTNPPFPITLYVTGSGGGGDTVSVDVPLTEVAANYPGGAEVEVEAVRIMHDQTLGVSRFVEVDRFVFTFDPSFVGTSVISTLILSALEPPNPDFTITLPSYVGNAVPANQTLRFDVAYSTASPWTSTVYIFLRPSAY